VSRRAVAGAGLALAVGLAGCGGATPARPSAGAGATETGRAVVESAVLVQVHARVLVDARGYPLYIYLPDQARAVTCAGECAGLWPPLLRPAHSRVTVGTGVRADLVGTDPDPVSGTVVTYAHWPLYTYTGDPQPGIATGQGLDVDGGYWYLMAPDGSPIVASQ
jgi:predicted lipoprotein with Yx(FWY)xxD motif